MSPRLIPTHVPWPVLKSELAPGERLLLDVFRRWLMGIREGHGAHWAILWNELNSALGPADAKAGLTEMTGIMRELGENGRRAIRFHPACCPDLGADETWLIALIGACQTGDLKRARLLAEWMVQADGVGDMVGSACSLACVLQAHALMLPTRPDLARPDLARPDVARPDVARPDLAVGA